MNMCGKYPIFLSRVTTQLMFTFIYYMISRHLSTEIGQEYVYRTEKELVTDDLMTLALEIVPFFLKHNAEADAVDLLLELEAIDQLPQYVDEDTYARVCLYMVRYIVVQAFSLSFPFLPQGD